MITSDQIHAARVLLGWSAAELAAMSGVPEAVVADVEAGLCASEARRAGAALRNAFEAAGVVFDAGPTRIAAAGSAGPTHRRRVGPEDEERGQQAGDQPLNRDD